MHGWHHIRLHATTATQNHNHEDREKVSKKGSGEERAVERKSRGVLMSCMARSLMKERGEGDTFKEACVREVSEARSGGEWQRCTKNKNLCFVPFRTTEWGIRGPHKMPGKTLDSKHKPTAVAERGWITKLACRTPCLGSSALKPSCVSRSCVSRSYRQPTALQPYRPPAPCTRRTACPKPPTL